MVSDYSLWESICSVTATERSSWLLPHRDAACDELRVLVLSASELRTARTHSKHTCARECVFYALFDTKGIRRNSCVHLLGQLGNNHEMMVGAKLNCSQCSKCQRYLNNLLIRHARNKKVLFVFVWVELDAVRYLPVGEAGDTLACGEKKIEQQSLGIIQNCFWE